MTTKILIECKHLASVPGPDGTFHHIAFDPNQATRERVADWKHQGDERVIEIEDRAGLHIRDRAASVLDTCFDYGTLRITTNV